MVEFFQCQGLGKGHSEIRTNEGILCTAGLGSNFEDSAVLGVVAYACKSSI